MRTLISNANIVNEGKIFCGHLVIENDVIAEVSTDSILPHGNYDEYVEATGCIVMPGVIDTHVHFREPGLTQKADIASESRAAAYGGVTSYFDMPNTMPQTTTIEALQEKFELARQKSSVNYAFFFGATNDNIPCFDQLPKEQIPGIKLFMGSSTGNMLVDREEALQQVFTKAANLPVVAHCEDTTIINERMAAAMEAYGDDPPIWLHPTIRSAEACLKSTKTAINMARKNGTTLHLAHLSTAAELELIDPVTQGDPLPQITAEAVVAHLLFSQADYDTKGALIKCNPSVKTSADRDELRHALSDGRICTIATDHAPHRWEEKQGGCRKAASGMPMVQFSLPAMLELTDKGIITIERMVQLMCHHPALRFDVRERGFLRKGYKADIVVVRPHTPWRVTPDIIQSKCAWSPVMNHEYQWQIEHTFCNGKHLLNHGMFDEEYRGEPISFSR